MLSGASRLVSAAAMRMAHASPDAFSPLAIGVYAIVLALVHEATALPLTFYRSFLLERRYGLSSEPLAVWVRDHAKAVGLGLLLGLAGAEIVYFAMSVSPEWWWLASALVFIAMMGVMAKIAPVVLLPMFYTFTPLDRESLRDR